MEYYYTDERNAQIVISLLKSHGIKKVIVSPGTTNICLVSSLSRDTYFELYSSPEERSAAYMACGLSAETGEVVVIICTGATASRNYLPALTEAYYRKLPILAITCSRRSSRIGHNIDQVTDRTNPPKDSVKLSVQVPLVYDYESEWADVIAVNKAILELHHNGNGPVHINLETNYSTNYSVKQLPEIRSIFRITQNNGFPKLIGDRICVLVSAHLAWSEILTELVEEFCEEYNAFVICDHISNYKGKYAFYANLSGQQNYYSSKQEEEFDVLIHMGDIFVPSYNVKAKNVWRVSPDGQLVDTFGKLKYVFEMEEEVFFKYYVTKNGKKNKCYSECEEENVFAKSALNTVVSQLPFSNAWIASLTSDKLPLNSVLHLGIQNSLRFWSFFGVPSSVSVYSNVGGFGIDGSLATVIGASLANSSKIYYCVLGDLAFFYDINSLGNRHIGNNVRIILINNGKGTEFRLSGNPGSLFGDDADCYIAAAGHYGNKSDLLVKNFAENLGLKYYAAKNKKEYESILGEIVSPEIGEKSLIVEVFTNSQDEDKALTIIRSCMIDKKIVIQKKTKKVIKKIIGAKTVERIKMLKRKV